MQEDILVKNLVLIGGGHSHVHVIKMMGMKPLRGLQVTLITKDVDTPYSGMLPGYVAGVYTKEECHIDLRKLCSFARIRLIHAEVNKLDVDNKLVYCADGRPPFRYDVLSVDIGITPTPLNSTDLAYDRLTPVKPIDRFAQRWDTILARILSVSSLQLKSSMESCNFAQHEDTTCLSTSSSSAESTAVTYSTNKPFKVVVVGGGGGGVELAFAIYHRLKNELKKRERGGDIKNLVKVVIITRGEGIMQSHCHAAQKILTRLALEKGIEIVPNTEIVDARCNEVSSSIQSQPSKVFQLISKDGRLFEFDEAIWCTQACAQNWLKMAGLECLDDGFVCVKKTLESVNIPGIFASGDVAHLVDNPRPKAGVFAVRAGPPLLDNIRRKLLGQPLNDWIPQSTFLGIIGTGDGYAVASKGPIALEGEYLWKLKDKIDRFWMSGYQSLPDMEEMMKKKQFENNGGDRSNNSDTDTNEIPQLARSQGADIMKIYEKSKMRCGGCGSKVGSQMLERVLRKVRRYRYDRPEVIKGVGDDCALVRIPKYTRTEDDDGSEAPIMVYTIDYFRSFISDPFIFGQIAVNHALSDVFAMNAEPITALALCVLPFGKEDIVEEQLVHLMAGAMIGLSKEKCALVGGHTAEGRDTSLGFSVTGVAKSLDSILHKGPPHSGDFLILTKALGTGVVMAADMRGKAKGTWVSATIDSMLVSNRHSAEILFKHKCTACTDVTGFGLMGHLLEMMKADVEEDEEKDSLVSIGPKLYDISAILSLSKIPILAGVAECIKMGISSSLLPQNIRCAKSVVNSEFAKSDQNQSNYSALFDPQTSGGLLATVPAECVEAVIVELRDAGYLCAEVIGRIVPTDSLLHRSEGVLSPSVLLE